jgi:hypothetical protein
MGRFWKQLKVGEKVILIGVSGIVLLALTGLLFQTVLRHSDQPLYPIRTHYEFAGEGFRGSELFRLKNCTNCHKAVGNGTNMGLELDGIGSRRDLAYLESFLRDPEATYAGHTVDHGPGREADYVARLPADEQRAIAIFLSQLKSDRGAATAKAPPEGKSTFIDAMLDLWAPDGWRMLFSDVRSGEDGKGGVKGAPPPGPAAAPAAASAVPPPAAQAPGTAAQETVTQGKQGSTHGN